MAEDTRTSLIVTGNNGRLTALELGARRDHWEQRGCKECMHLGMAEALEPSGILDVLISAHLHLNEGNTCQALGILLNAQGSVYSTPAQQ